MTNATLLSLATARANRMTRDEMIGPGAVPTLLASFGGDKGISRADANRILRAEKRKRGL